MAQAKCRHCMSETKLLDDVIPVLHTVGGLYQPEGEPTSVTDEKGNDWLIGWHNGVRYKRRLSRRFL